MSEPPTICEVTIVRARKAWKCCECRKPITPGQQYESAHGLWEGEWDTYRTCIPCRDLRDACAPLCREAWGHDDWHYGGLRETVAELRTWSSEMAARVATIILASEPHPQKATG